MPLMPADEEEHHSGQGSPGLTCTALLVHMPASLVAEQIYQVPAGPDCYCLMSILFAWCCHEDTTLLHK